MNTNEIDYITKVVKLYKFCDLTKIPEYLLNNHSFLSKRIIKYAFWDDLMYILNSNLSNNYEFIYEMVNICNFKLKSYNSLRKKHKIINFFYKKILLKNFDLLYKLCIKFPYFYFYILSDINILPNKIKELIQNKDYINFSFKNVEMLIFNFLYFSDKKYEHFLKKDYFFNIIKYFSISKFKYVKLYNNEFLNYIRNYYKNDIQQTFKLIKKEKDFILDIKTNFLVKNINFNLYCIKKYSFCKNLDVLLLFDNYYIYKLSEIKNLDKISDFYTLEQIHNKDIFYILIKNYFNNFDFNIDFIPINLLNDKSLFNLLIKHKVNKTLELLRLVYKKIYCFQLLNDVKKYILELDVYETNILHNDINIIFKSIEYDINVVVKINKFILYNKRFMEKLLYYNTNILYYINLIYKKHKNKIEFCLSKFVKTTNNSENYSDLNLPEKVKSCKDFNLIKNLINKDHIYEMFNKESLTKENLLNFIKITKFGILDKIPFFNDDKDIVYESIKCDINLIRHANIKYINNYVMNGFDINKIC